MTEPTEEVFSETPETFRPPEPAQPAEKHLRRSLIVGVSGLPVLIVLFALLFAAFSNRSTVSGGAPPTPTKSIDWQRYTDPDGHFTLSIPKGWTVERETDTLIAGDSHGSVTFYDTLNAFGGPPHGQNTITFWIYVEPIESDRARQWMCHAWSPVHYNTTLAGLPAVTDDVAVWLVNSSDAHFQINYRYPNWKGDVVMTGNEPTATPMPPGFYQRGQQDFHTILASFMPTPDTPLQCP